MNAESPFDLLSLYESRCVERAVGLPKEDVVQQDWVGIGFRVLDETMLIKMSDVSEILPVPEMIRIPGVKKWILGLANIRGTLLPLVDLRGYLVNENGPVTRQSRILAINKQNVQAGLLVDEVFGMRRFKPEQLQPEALPEENLFHRLIVSRVQGDQRNWTVFSVEKLVNLDSFLDVV